MSVQPLLCKCDQIPRISLDDGFSLVCTTCGFEIRLEDKEGNPRGGNCFASDAQIIKTLIVSIQSIAADLARSSAATQQNNQISQAYRQALLEVQSLKQEVAFARGMLMAGTKERFTREDLVYSTEEPQSSAKCQTQ